MNFNIRNMAEARCFQCSVIIKLVAVAPCAADFVLSGVSASDGSTATDGFNHISFVQPQIDALGVVLHGDHLPGAQGAYQACPAE